MGRHTIAHPYAVPVLTAFDAIRNCSHCRRNTDEDCKAWRKARESVAVFRQEARRLAKGVGELRCGREESSSPCLYALVITCAA